MNKVLKIIIATLAIAVIGSAVFYACKKEEVKDNTNGEKTLQEKVSSGDTIYIPGGADGYTQRPDCEMKGDGCLPDVVISVPRLRNEIVPILNNMVNMNPLKNKDKIITHRELFKEILSPQWYNMIIDGNLTITVRKKLNKNNAFILDAMYIQSNGNIIPANVSLPVCFIL
jgi:hypothetical protein